MIDIARDIFTKLALPAIEDFIRNPAQSPNFEPDWKKKGDLRRACEQAVAWAKALVPDGTFEVIEDEGRTPVVLVDIPSTGFRAGDAGVFFYGHFDKQPPSAGWDEGLAAFTPVVRDGRLYGRGSCDDGFAFYCAIAALLAARKAGNSHPRITGLFETREESGSDDYPHYLEKMKGRFGRVGTVFVLDSSANDYDNLWVTSSLRGIIAATLRVKTLSYPVHSGMFSGMLPDAYLVAQALLARVADLRTGNVLLPAFAREVTPTERQLLADAVEVLGGKLFERKILAEGVEPLYPDALEAAMQNVFGASLCVIGAEGLPGIPRAGNALCPEASLRLSIRVPALVDLRAAYAALEEALTKGAPFGAEVTLENPSLQSGWSMALKPSPELARLKDAAQAVFGQPARFMGIGASIPIVYNFEAAFPSAVCILTGVEGPGSNAHGPNESLVLDYTARLVAALALYLSER